MLNIDGKNYQLPEWVLNHNAQCGNFYKVMSVCDIVSGNEDFDRMGNDWLESDCFGAYASEHNMVADDVNIEDVKDALFAILTDYDAEDYTLVYLKPVL